MRALWLLNKVMAGTIADVEAGRGHDNWLYGMLRIRAHGVQSELLEIEQFIPARVARWLRAHLLTMHYAHLPLFPLFFRYDVVFTSTAYGCLVLKALFRIKRFKWIILDFNLLGTIGEGKQFRQRVFAWAIAHGADGIVAISEAAERALKDRFPHLADRIVFIREATDTEYFKPQEGVAEKDVVLSVGNFGRDFDVVIEATKDLGVECRLATKLISPEKAKTLPPHVTVRLYTHQEMLHNYAESKIAFVGIDPVDRYTDSVGTFALIEAMAMGKATILSDTKSAHSYAEPDVTGVFVPQHDAVALRAAIQALLKDGARRQALGGAARAFIKEYAHSERFAREVATYFTTIVAK